MRRTRTFDGDGHDALGLVSPLVLGHEVDGVLADLELHRLLGRWNRRHLDLAV